MLSLVGHQIREDLGWVTQVLEQLLSLGQGRLQVVLLEALDQREGLVLFLGADGCGVVVVTVLQVFEGLAEELAVL